MFTRFSVVEEINIGQTAQSGQTDFYTYSQHPALSIKTYSSTKKYANKEQSID